MKKSLIILLTVLLLVCPACATQKSPLGDGRYTVEATLTGGSGRANVESPVALAVESGGLTATVVWSSPYYEWMKIDGVQYDPVQTEGNSTFVIPVILDADIPVSAQTVAMSEPHVIEYTLYFDSASIKAAD